MPLGPRLVLTRSEIAGIADPRSYARGVSYYTDRRVEDLVAGDGDVSAVVRGTAPYRVTLRRIDAGIEWSCSCPMGDEGWFCKHCVAVALSAAAGEEGGPPEPSAAEGPVPSVDLGAFVASLGRERLVEIVLAQTGRDPRLLERLEVEARRVAGLGIDVPGWRARIDAAFAPYDDHVGYWEATGWAAGIHEIMESLGEIAAAEPAEEIALLLEHVHRQADLAVGYVDDDGELGGIAVRAAELHHDVCARVSLDPVALAQRLVALDLDAELDGFAGAAATYAGVLGPTGLAEYRRVVAARDQALDPDADRWGAAFRVEEALASLAIAERDPDALIAVRRRGDRIAPHDVLEISRLLHHVGRVEEAIEWARRGLAGRRTYQHADLEDHLAVLLRESGDPAAAAEVFWVGFTQDPGVSTYRRWLGAAGGDGEAASQALDWLRAQVAGIDPEAGYSPLPRALIEILLFEGVVDEAWQVAGVHGAGDRLWLSLAHERGRTHPEDAAPVFFAAAEREIATVKRRGYETAVQHLRAACSMLRAANRYDDFAAEIARIRTEHARKRTLMGMLGAEGW